MPDSATWRLVEHSLPRVVWAHFGYHRPGMTMPEHGMSHHVLDVILAGDASWTRNGQPQQLVNGSAYLYGPGDRAGAGTIGTHGLRFIGIIFNWAGLVHGQGGMPSTIMVPPRDMADFTVHLRGIVDLVRAGGSSHLSVGSRLALALTQLFDWSMTPSRGAEGDLAARAMALLRQHRSRVIAIDAIARMLGVGAAHLRKRMAARYGRPPLQLLNELRLEDMRRLLAVERSAPIEAICRRAGFDDRRHASRMFLRQYGMTPLRFRRSLPPG